MKNAPPEPAKAGTTLPGAFRLRLWLPGYHTPSGNGTIGKHWSKVYKLKKAAAGHLLAALGETEREMGLAEKRERGEKKGGVDSDFSCLSSFSAAADLVAFAKRILMKIAMGVRLETKRGKKAGKPVVPAWLRIERVCVSVCDEDNFKGGTKGLVDCLRYAFPAVLIDDAPGYVVMEHVQTKCGKRCEEGTWVCLEGGDNQTIRQSDKETAGLVNVWAVKDLEGDTEN